MNNFYFFRKKNIHPLCRVYLLFLLVFSGCSSGRYYIEPNLELIDPGSDSQLEQEIIESLNTRKIADCLTHLNNENDKQILFVHPGLILIINWGGHRARDAGLFLAQDGYIEAIYEVRSRKSREIYEKMIAENRENYLGLHYSMGGNPRVIAAAIEAARLASENTKEPVRYNVILVEPFDFPSFEEHIDLDDQHLGQIIVLVSENNSFLRPNIGGASIDVMKHKKLHFIYAEDLGLNWGHFSFLSDVRETTPENEKEQQRAKELLYSIATILQTNMDSDDIDRILSNLKVRYAFEDNRNIHKSWFQKGIIEIGEIDHLCHWNEKHSVVADR